MVLLRMGGRLKKALDLAWFQLAMLAGREAAIVDVTDPNAAEFHYRVADRIEHSPDLLVFAFAENDFVPVVTGFPRALDQTNSGRRGSRLAKSDPATQALDLIFAGRALHFCVIDLLDFSTLRQKVRQLAIVGENDQPFGVEVETADRMKPAARRRR